LGAGLTTKRGVKMREETLSKRIARKRLDAARKELYREPTIPRFIREASASEIEIAAEKRGHNIFTCVHGKHYFTPCVQCKRNNDDAKKWEKFWREQSEKIKRVIA
jgi:hypothetical protein